MIGTKKAAGFKTGGEMKPWKSGLRADGIGANAARALARQNRQSHLLAERSADEAANAMSLPAGNLHEFLQRGAALALQQVKDVGGLAAPVISLVRGSAFGARSVAVAFLVAGQPTGATSGVCAPPRKPPESPQRLVRRLCRFCRLPLPEGAGLPSRCGSQRFDGR